MTIRTGAPVYHHIGFAVRDADATAKAYTELAGGEFRLMPPYMVKNMKGEECELRVYYGAMAGSIVEIIQTVRGVTPHSMWVEEHGDGIQHLGMYVPDVVAATKEMIEKGAGIRWVYPNKGEVNLTVNSSLKEVMGEALPSSLTYLDPGAGGVIIELLGPPIHHGVVGGAVKGLEEYWETSFPKIG